MSLMTDKTVRPSPARRRMKTLTQAALNADKTVEQRTVVADNVSESESVVQKGLSSGETVVTDGQLNLVPGSTVTVKETAEAPAPGARS